MIEGASELAGTAKPAVQQPPWRTLSVVIPVFNEAPNLARLAERLTAALDDIGRDWDVIFVDDGSKDESWAVLSALHAADRRFRALALSRNFGKEVAVAAGLRHTKGDGVVVMDGDLQHPPEVIKDLVSRWQEGYDVAYGRRRDRATDTELHRVAARAFYRVFHVLSGTELPDGAGDFRLLDRKVVDAFNRLDERARFNKGLFAWVGFKSVGVPFDVAPRFAGRSRWRPWRLFGFAMDGLASFTTLPLRVWSWLGLIVSAISLGYATVFLVKTLIWGTDVPGFPTIVVSVMLLSGIQLISLGVIGEYIGRVYEEVKGRPLFIVGETLGLGSDPGQKRDGPRDTADAG